MLNISREKIIDAYMKSSPVVQGIFDADWVPENMQIISKKISIRLDKTDQLIKLVGFVVLNLIPLSRFLDVVEAELNVDRDRATIIVQEIDEHIFKKVREIIKEHNEKKEEEQEKKKHPMVQKNKIKTVDPYREEF